MTRTQLDLPPVKKGERLVGDLRQRYADELARAYVSSENVSVRVLVRRSGLSYGSVHRLLTVDAGLTLRRPGGDKRSPDALCPDTDQTIRPSSS
ncbi:helix-turn-helix domain-containing protein [Streptomyces sp. NPDC057617]|uniref:helix-turn-helix domain-containing protein n=1 Tax=unclassified Streptomyces TaxID=2593676 RepID=UPI0036BD33E2